MSTIPNVPVWRSHLRVSLWNDVTHVRSCTPAHSQIRAERFGKIISILQFYFIDLFFVKIVIAMILFQVLLQQTCNLSVNKRYPLYYASLDAKVKAKEAFINIENCSSTTIITHSIF